MLPKRPSFNLLDSLLQEAGAIWLVSSSLFQIKSGELGPSVGLILEYQLLFSRERRTSTPGEQFGAPDILASWLARVDLDSRAGVSDI